MWRSLRWRLWLATLAALGVALLAAGWGLAGLFREHATQQFERQLQRQLDLVTAQLEVDGDRQPRLRTGLNDPRWHTPYAGLYWQIDALPRQGGAPLRSRSLWDTVLALPDDTPAEGELHRHTLPGPDGQTVHLLERAVRLLDQPGAPAWRIAVAADTAELEAAVARFSGRLLTFLAVLGAALLAAASAQLAVGLAPLRQLQAAVQAVRQGRQPRLQGRFPSEVQPLVDDFNRVLAHDEQVAQRARQTAGNLAHAIKTPLAVLSQLAGHPPADPADWAPTLQEQVQAVRRQVDWHLQRARAAGAGAPGRLTPLGPVLDGLLRVMRKVHAPRDDGPPLALDLAPVDAQACFAGEPQDLQEMAGNLLDNACKWAATRVALKVTPCDGGWRLTVDDDGPGLSATQRQAVLARGVRADERVPGSGLGLDIVREIAQLYQGELVLEASPLGGLRATLTLPGVPG
nr:ATP-binding protein [Aquabacterium sp. A08]